MERNMAVHPTLSKPVSFCVHQIYTDVVLMLFMTGVVRAEPHSSLTAFTHSNQRVTMLGENPVNYKVIVVISQLLL